MNHWEKQIKSIAYKIKQTLAAMVIRRERDLDFCLFPWCMKTILRNLPYSLCFTCNKEV